MISRTSCWIIPVLVASIGCGAQAPTRPTGAAVPTASGDGRAVALSDDNELPSAIFRTSPRADGRGVIPGGFPLEVTFNTCPSSDVDPGDRLKTTYDFDGDGRVDLAGYCRTTYRFEASARPRVCITDRQPDHEVCKTYEVGRPPGDLTCVPKGVRSLEEVEPNGYGMIGPGPLEPMVVPFGSVRIAGGIKRDGDDYFAMEANPCDRSVLVQVRIYGGDGPGDCAADPRSILRLAAGEQYAATFFTAGTQFSGTACSEPLSLLVAPGHGVNIVHAGLSPWPPDYPVTTYAPERYVLEILVTPDR